MKPRDALEADPVAELRRYRQELSQRFQTLEELIAYYDTIPPTEEIIADLKKKIAEKKKLKRKKAKRVETSKQ